MQRKGDGREGEEDDDGDGGDGDDDFVIKMMPSLCWWIRTGMEID